MQHSSHESNLDDTPHAPQETLLEFVQETSGKMVLRPMHANDNIEPLLSIEFSQEIQDMLGGDIQFIGQSMIQAAMQSFMQKQIAQYHAHVYDEEPERFS
ncbi:hypothetical protein MOMA_01145 [Moraxella macacae 0408225]|uniref:Uncharacterized protein n=1 Tax=Moraxella macacae 0408225 TaxID=1230338 RepID=L2F7G4_9GAMM|nr:hypothetical protein [Moraxella macacae]ELA08972.1 hypothetical protein MOMA_01145 [Moraxella macacae 0408225]